MKQEEQKKHVLIMVANTCDSLLKIGAWRWSFLDRVQ